MKLLFAFILSFCISTMLCAHPATSTRVETINSALEKQSKNYQLYLQRGNLHRENHDFSLAAEDFEAARLTGAPTEIFLYHKALLLIDQGQYKAANSLLKQAITAVVNMDQQNKSLLSLLYLNLAELYVQQNLWLDAANNYAQVYKLNKNVDSIVYLMAANLYIKAGKSHYSQAIASLEHGLNQHPRVLCMHKRLITLETEMLQLKSAFKRLEALIELQPELLHKTEQFVAIECDMTVNFVYKSLGGHGDKI